MGGNQKDEEREAWMEAFFAAVADSYHRLGTDEAMDSHKKFQLTADEFGITEREVQKILITTGDYKTAQAGEIAALQDQGFHPMAIAEKIRRYEAQKRALEVLRNDITSLALWKAIILFAGYPFKTSGRNGKGAVTFQYSVPKSPGNAGKHYRGESVEGYGNEIKIENRGKSITRSSVDYALKIACDKKVKGPKELKIYGASYIFALFKRFGLV